MMGTGITIQQAAAGDVPDVAVMVGELLAEIMASIGTPAFHFDLQETTARLEDFVARGKYVVFLARDAQAEPVGFLSLYESYALYAEGTFGTIPELYVRPGFRSRAVGRRLLAKARAYGTSRGWRRLEVTTPPLPQFDRALSFYEREGFSITGGRKLKTAL